MSNVKIENAETEELTETEIKDAKRAIESAREGSGS